MATQAGAPPIYTAPQIAAMDVTQRAAYFNSLPPDVRAQQQAAYKSFQMTMNRNYMRNTVLKKVVAPQSSGGGLSQTYSPGATLPFTIPSAQNAFLQGFYIRLNLSATLAAGTSAVYAATAGAPWTLLDNVVVQYNGTQARFRPYFLKQLEIISGYLQPIWPNAVVAGQHNTTLDTYMSSGSVPTATGTSTLTYEIYVPLNALHPQDVRGLLPIMGGETACQVLVTCAPQALGVDPILNTWSAASGSGHAVTFANTSTVSIIACYRDGTSYLSPTLLGCDLSGIGTVQYAIDVPLTGITAGNIFRQKVSIMDKMYFIVLTVVDGNQSNKFSALSNFAVLESDKDAVGSNTFWKYGTGTNMSVLEYFDELRLTFGQDVDEGIVPLVYAPTYGQADAGDMEGTHYLDTSTAGWPDFHYGIQLNSVGSVSGITPRVECHVVFVNSAGLINA